MLLTNSLANLLAVRNWYESRDMRNAWLHQVTGCFCMRVALEQMNNEVVGSIPGPAALRAFGFQYMLDSAGFSPGIPAFLLHSKLILRTILDSLLKISFIVSLLGTMYQVGFPWWRPNKDRWVNTEPSSLCFEPKRTWLVDNVKKLLSQRIDFTCCKTN